MLRRGWYVGLMVAGSPLNVSEVKCELLSDYQYMAGLKVFIEMDGCEMTWLGKKQIKAEEDLKLGWQTNDFEKKKGQGT